MQGIGKLEMRQATAGDVDLVWRMFRQSMKEYITEARGEWNEEREESQFTSQLDLPASQLIQVDAQEVGFIMTPVRDGVLWIHTICIVPEHRRKGIGTEVIRSVIAEAKRQNLPLCLRVLKVNPARELYERLGFKVTEESRHHYQMQFQTQTWFALRALLSIPTLETIDQYWSSFLGCDRKDFFARGTVVVPHAELSDWHGIYGFLRNEFLVISVPENLLDEFRARAIGWSPADMLKEERLRALLELRLELVVGPAFVGYTDRVAFRPAPAEATWVLEQQDAAVLADLKAACSALE
jgi:GNAT superfamily N-acetyltransferase